MYRCNLVMDRIPELGFLDTWNQPKWVNGKLNKAFIHFLPSFWHFSVPSTHLYFEIKYYLNAKKLAKKRGKTLFNWPFNPISPQYFQNPKPEFQVVADPSLIGTYKLNNPLLLLGLPFMIFFAPSLLVFNALFTPLQPIWMLATTKKTTYSFFMVKSKGFPF